MEKTQAQALAAVICRAIDYFHARSTAERDAENLPKGSTYADAIIARLSESEKNVADALEAIPDES